MKLPGFYVDFNELIERDLVALAKDDTKLTSTGEHVVLREGLAIEVYSDGLMRKESQTIYSLRELWSAIQQSGGPNV